MDRTIQNVSACSEQPYKFHEMTGQSKSNTLNFAERVVSNPEHFSSTKEATGIPHPIIDSKILEKIARGMSSEEWHTRLHDIATLLPALRPQDETEAILLGQFLALQDSGMKCLHLANLPEQGFYHIERLFHLAHKLLNTANQTMLTVLKYRSKGQQTVQVVHVHNEGQAIVTQTLSPTQQGGNGKNL